MRITRATIVGIVGGFVVLALFAGFAIGLPKVTGKLPELPDKLPPGFVAISAATAGDFGVTSAADTQGVAQLVENAKLRDKESSDHLSELYGDASVRTYVDPAAFAQARQTGTGVANFTVTVVNTAPGLVIPSGPMQVEVSGQHYETKKIGDAQCAATFTDAQPATQTTPATGTTYLQTECRESKGDFTYDVYGSNVSTDDVTAILKSLVA